MRVGGRAGGRAGRLGYWLGKGREGKGRERDE
ncbi:hypothetical protein E2C01_090798 [Portunus trituberculatus]|uniref:Uncharacterized protein n=1 Tax=Portunus trituberculatus TaxID=210409 RepID=A0A5B7JFQ0_PORTR|nr:hypothetical protein [Portunus trituberculatus]